ncbi:MAG: Flp pilus assembly protein CpaB [Novosphingobium sp.]|nr:Flp pilus assembly protein CpaB [Novosphingobium sp.]
MSRRNLIVGLIAVVLGLFAVIIVNAYFSSVEQQQERAVEQQRLVRVVVAAQDLAFGDAITEQGLQLAPWPAASVPQGAFQTIAEALKGGRVALRPIVRGEPVLASRVSGPGGRATLSANLPSGKLAFAIAINDVSGVGGFVRPGDVVDVLLTRKIPGEGAAEGDKMTDILLESVPVLGINKVGDDGGGQPAPQGGQAGAAGKDGLAAASLRTATLEVDRFGAQKLALAGELGSLSLALRNVADRVPAAAFTMLPRQLGASNYVIPARPGAPAAAVAAAAPVQPGRPSADAFRPRGPSMTVVRGTVASEYPVLRGY